MHELVSPIFNFSVLVGGLVYYLRQPVKNFVATRHDTLRNELGSVRDLLKTAREKHDEFTAKLRAVDAEIVVLREQAKQDAQAMRSRVLAEAKRLSDQIIEDSKVAALGLYGEFRSQLYLELVGRVLDRAEVVLKERLTGDDRVRIRQEFSRQVEGAS